MQKQKSSYVENVYLYQSRAEQLEFIVFALLMGCGDVDRARRKELRSFGPRVTSRATRKPETRWKSGRNWRSKAVTRDMRQWGKSSGRGYVGIMDELCRC